MEHDAFYDDMNNEPDDEIDEDGLLKFIPGSEGLRLISCPQRKFLLFQGEHRIAVIDNVTELADLHGQINLYLRLNRWPISTLPNSRHFPPVPPDDPSNFPN